nr:MAG: hypothetical protein KatS3mg041_1009 [Bacteroidota bacterium]
MHLARVAFAVLIPALLFGQSSSSIRVLEFRPEAYVQWGFEEAFVPLTNPVVLSRLDAVATGPRGRIVLEVEGRRLELGPMAVLELSAARELTPREVLLGLERIRSRRLPGEQPVRLSRAPITRGAEDTPFALPFDPLERAERRWRGLEALAEAGFWGSFVLEARSLIDEVPPLGQDPERRLAIVLGLARVGLSGEAAQEFRWVVERFGSTHRPLIERFLRQYGRSLSM